MHSPFTSTSAPSTLPDRADPHERHHLHTGRRAALRTLASTALLAVLPVFPLSAQARIALSTAINRTARFRALSQRMAKAYAQLSLNVHPERAREVITASRQLTHAGFDDLGQHPWPSDVAQSLQEVRRQSDKLEELVANPPSKETLGSVSVQADKTVEAANSATLALEKLAQAQTAKVVTMSGKLRLMSQRLAKNYNLQAAGVETKSLREQLASDKLEFKRTLDELEKAPISTPAIRDQLALAQGQWVFFEAALQRQPDPRGLESMASTSERLLEVMDHLTGLYEAVLKDVLG